MLPYNIGRSGSVRIMSKLKLCLSIDDDVRRLTDTEFEAIDTAVYAQLYGGYGFDEMELDDIYQKDNGEIEAIYSVSQNRRYNSSPETRWEPAFFEVEDEITENDINLNITGYSLDYAQLKNTEYEVA